MSKVKHIVLLKFKDGTTDEQVNKFFDDILDLSESIPGIDDYVGGSNISNEGRTQGLTHGFIMTFADSAARDNYVVHADHEKFVSDHMPMVDNIVVLDFEV